MTNLEGSKKWTQDEIINNTKNVVRGLETLKNEHSGILSNLNSSHDKNGESELETEKGAIIQESIEKIELGLGEAQVWSCSVRNSLYDEYMDSKKAIPIVNTPSPSEGS